MRLEKRYYGPFVIDDALLALLRTELGADLRFVVTPQPVSGGFWATIHRFRLGPDKALAPELRGQLVIRVMPDRTVALHETAVQRCAADLGFPTPPVLLAGFDEGVGGAFIVMPLVLGRSPLSDLDIGRSLLRVPGILRRLPSQLATVSAQLHSLDPVAVDAALTAAGVRSRYRGVDSRMDVIAMGEAAGGIGFTGLLAWLRSHRGRGSADVLCHGDIHPLNLLVDDDSGKITLLDWTNANLLPREFDLGFTVGLLRCAPLVVPSILRRPLDLVTNRLAERFLEAYSSRAKFDPVAVEWYEALQYGRCLAEVAVARSGTAADFGQRHPFEVASPAMLRRLAAITGLTITLPSRLPAPTS